MLKTKIFRIILIAIVPLLILSLVLIYFTFNGVNARAREIERNFNAFEEKLDAILQWPEQKDLVITDRTYDKDFEALCELGIGSVPLLLEIKFQNTYPTRDNLIMDGIYTLLAVDGPTIVDNYKTQYAEPYYDIFVKFFQDSKTKIPEILGSNLTMEEKIDRLSLFGVLAIPYLQKSSLTEELAAYCVSIELYLPPESRGDVAPKKLPEEEEARLKAEFDYQKWLSDNKYDLILLQKYVDGLTG